MAAGGALWLIWLGATGLGYALGGSLASLALLTLPTPLVLLTMTVRAAVDRPTLVAAGTAAVVGVAGLGIPHGLGLVFAAFAGVTAGLLAEALVRRPLAGAPA
jgi:branched chain amino acid efflux pump